MKKDLSYYHLYRSRYDSADMIYQLIKENEFDINAFTRTPSSYISEVVFQSNNVDVISQEIQMVVYDLDKFYIEICRRFARLKYDIYKL